MTWAAQAAHVARKDIRFARWSLVTYAVLAAVALEVAIQLPAIGQANRIPSMALMAGIVLFGLILGASAVQSDSPTQSTAFWASRPFHPTAMLGAKLLYCAVAIIGIPFVAQVIGLMVYQVPLDERVAILLQSAAIYGLLLLAGIVVASLTSDLRGFIVGGLVITISLILGVIVLGSFGRWAFPFSFPTSLVPIGAVAISLGLLVWLYRRRDVSRLAWLGAAIAVGLALDAIAAVGDFSQTDAPQSLRAGGIEVALIAPKPQVNPTALALTFRADRYPPGVRLQLRIDSAIVLLRDGTRVRALPNFNEIFLDGGVSMLPADTRRFGIENLPDSVRSYRSSLRLSFSAKDRDKLARGVASIALGARVAVTQRVELAQTPLGRSLAKTVDGVRIRVADTFGPRGDRESVTVATAMLAPSSAAERVESPISAALINDALHEGVILSSSRFSTSNDYLLLPGAPVDTRTIVYSTKPTSLTRDEIMSTTSLPGAVVETTVEDDAPSDTGVSGEVTGLPKPGPSWYDGAKVVVYRWVARGSYPIRLTKQVQ